MAIIGPTASGKSALALELARRSAISGPAVGTSAASPPAAGTSAASPSTSGTPAASGTSATSTELLYADSMAVYRHMDIGTAKPTAAEQAEVRHHLIDLVEPGEAFTVVEYQAAFDAAKSCVLKRGAQPLLVGGSGLYLRAVIDRLTPPPRFPEVVESLCNQPTAELYERLTQLDPLAASRMQPTNRRRIVRAVEVTVGSGQPFSSFGPGLDSYPPVPYTLIGIDINRSKLDERIAQRYTEQIEAGFVEEVRELLAQPGGLSFSAAQALGYKELAAHLRGETSLAEAIKLAAKRTRRFARRQQRWFRRDPRITWVPFGSVAQMADQVLSIMAEGTTVGEPNVGESNDR